MATDLGKVGMVTKGAWNSSATYEVMDVVTYNNTLYIAKQNVPANTVPTNTTYWQEAIKIGGSVEVLNGTTDTNGNIAVGNLPTGTIPVAVRPKSNTDYNGIFSLFYSAPGNRWYIHITNWNGQAQTATQSNAIVYYSYF